jgi:hypothetical protein
MAIELVPLCTMRLQAKPPIEIGTGPAGTRLVFEVANVEVQGDRLRGQMEGIAGDWVLIGPEGTGTIDVRETLRTDTAAVDRDLGCVAARSLKPLPRRRVTPT